MNSLPFAIEITPGRPAYEQVVRAVHRAVASGILNPGDEFPSVRVLSKAVRINPNTAHKVVQQLVGDGTLEVIPGRGTRIAPTTSRSADARLEMIRVDLEDLVVEASRIGFSEEELTKSLGDTWRDLTKIRNKKS